MAARSVAESFTRREFIETCRQIRLEEKERRAHEREIRERAWYLYNPTRPYTWKWWRLGFQTRFGKRVADHDLTVIPGYDEFAQEMACIFPEFAGDAEKLWDLLLSPWVPYPKTEEIERLAEERLYYRAKDRERANDVSFDFGANTLEETEF